MLVRKPPEHKLNFIYRMIFNIPLWKCQSEESGVMSYYFVLPEGFRTFSRSAHQLSYKCFKQTVILQKCALSYSVLLQWTIDILDGGTYHCIMLVSFYHLTTWQIKKLSIHLFLFIYATITRIRGGYFLASFKQRS